MLDAQDHQVQKYISSSFDIKKQTLATHRIRQPATARPGRIAALGQVNPASALPFKVLHACYHYTMLNIQNLTYLQGGTTLLQQVNFQAYASQRIGLVGKNGCGKSTLFRLIRGEVLPDSGEISLQSGKTIAFVEQEIANSDQPALEFVLDGDVELRELEKNLAREQHDPAWFEAQHRYEAINGYMAKARAAQLLNGLGFANDTLERSVSSFSASVLLESGHPPDDWNQLVAEAHAEGQRLQQFAAGVAT